MKTFWIFCRVLLSGVFLGGCTSSYAPLPTVETVDIGQYLGTWYEIARYPNRFEKGCTGVTAEYRQKSEESILVTNRCRLHDPSGEEKVANGKAKIIEGSNNAKLKVTFFWPFYGDYWIIKLDPDYRYAVVGEPSRKYLWILAREKRISETVKNEIVSWLPQVGYDPEKLVWTQH